MKVNGYELDNYQKEAVFNNSKYTLLVAGAGTGKTLTIVGKINHLIENLNYKKEEILCISFTNDAVKSLKEKLNYDVEVLTFHKLALNIIGNNKDFKVAPSDYLEFIIEEYFTGYIYENDEWMNRILKYFKVSKKKNVEKSYTAYINSNKNEFKILKLTIARFIRLFKGNNYSIKDFYNIFKSNKNMKNILFLRVTLDIYLLYENELTSSRMLDFDSMISKSINYVSGANLKYKYIIIDEYQDTSYTRFLLINEIIKATNSFLFVVGDDFQSIYRFSGCNINMFLKFTNYFKDATVLKIVNTYRNSKELIEISGKFIMKNKKQIRKKLMSSKTIVNPVNIVYFKDQKEAFKKLIKTLYNENKNVEIMVLGRNNSDINKVLSKDFELESDNKLILRELPDLKMRYLTVHRSKGLESDIVIIINVINEKLGFPSKMEDDAKIKLVNKNIDSYYLEEERRLFYVALTRCKNKVYLLTNKKNKSIFIKELLRDNKKKIKTYN